MIQPKRWVLPIIIISQFFCTSIWFAGNGVMENLVQNFGLEQTALSDLTSAVQFGFISGTLIFALLSITDRYSPSKVFFFSAVLAAIANAGLVWQANDLISLIILRFLTGFFLAGIYPVGMKIASDYYEKGLGKSLGFLVGALVLGTSFPHFLNAFASDFDWRFVIYVTSFLAVLGGLLMFLLVANGPYRKPGQHLKILSFLTVFKNRNFRSAAFGYFGHMWELYAFWAFVPFILQSYLDIHPGITLHVSLLAFLIIGIGSLSCIVAAYLSKIFSTKKVARMALLLSGFSCLISPFVFYTDMAYLFVGFLFFWGMTVVADSPLLSTLVAQNAPSEMRGTALTIVNCIGFAISILSIQLLNKLSLELDVTTIYLVLALGPVLGVVALKKASA